MTLDEYNIASPEVMAENFTQTNVSPKATTRKRKLSALIGHMKRKKSERILKMKLAKRVQLKSGEGSTSNKPVCLG